jgi:low affinity Fe/Cu permease
MTQQSSDAPPSISSLPRVSLYQRVTDRVSYAQGTPANLTFWLIAIGLWFAFGPELAHATFLPAWVSSNAWNFPLNTGTSCLELFIGFLVAASTNRSERNLENALAAIQASEDRDAEAIKANAVLTQRVDELTGEIHRLAAQLATK